MPIDGMGLEVIRRFAVLHIFGDLAQVLQ